MCFTTKFKLVLKLLTFYGYVFYFVFVNRQEYLHVISVKEMIAKD